MTALINAIGQMEDATLNYQRATAVSSIQDGAALIPISQYYLTKLAELAAKTSADLERKDPDAAASIAQDQFEKTTLENAMNEATSGEQSQLDKGKDIAAAVVKLLANVYELPNSVLDVMSQLTALIMEVN